MTLVVAITTDDGVWMGGERLAGSFEYNEIAHPKLFELEGDGYHFGIGFAGEPRVAQAILAVAPPDQREGSLHWWLTEFCDRIHERTRDLGLTRDPGDEDPVYLAGHSGFVLGTAGRAFMIDRKMGWQETTRGYAAQGGAYSEFAAAFEVLREQHEDPVNAARAAWPFVQRLCRVGDLVDELVIPTGGDR